MVASSRYAPSWSAVPHHFHAEAVLFWLIHLCVYPSPDRISTEQGSKTFVRQWLRKLYKLLSVSYYKIPLLLAPALSLLGAGRLITFGAVLTNKLFSSCRTAFSDFRVEDIRSYPQAHSFHPRHFQGMPYVAAWASCRSSIFFQRNRTSSTIPPNWSVDMNQQP